VPTRVEPLHLHVSRLVGQFVIAFKALAADVHAEALKPPPDPPTFQHVAALLLDGVFLRRGFWLAVAAVAAVVWWFDLGTGGGF
jgi:hypothetical protein